MKLFFDILGPSVIENFGDEDDTMCRINIRELICTVTKSSPETKTMIPIRYNGESVLLIHYRRFDLRCQADLSQTLRGDLNRIYQYLVIAKLMVTTDLFRAFSGLPIFFSTFSSCYESTF